MTPNKLTIAAMLLFAVQGVQAQAPQCDTLQQIPGLYLYNFPATGVYHDDTMYCDVKLCGAYFDPDTISSLVADLNITEEYAIKMYTEDSLRIYGIAMIHNLVYGEGVLSLYDSAMNFLASTTMPPWNNRVSYLRSLHDSSNYHCFELAGLQHHPGEDAAGFTTLRMLYYRFFNPKEYPYVSVKGTFYIGYMTNGYGQYTHVSPFAVFLHELHQPPYAFPGSDYRLKVAGVWEDHHAARSLPMIFPITLPEDEQPGGGDPENPDPDNPNPDNPPEGIDGVAGVQAELTPNPATGRVKVACGEALRRVEVYDLQGRRCLAQEVQGTETELDISALAAGRYTVLLHTATTTAARPLIVQ